MKGLIYKDFQCLKQQIRFFMLLCIACIIACVLYILSSRFGNVKLALDNAVNESAKSGNDISDVKNLIGMISNIVLYAILCIPLALTEQITFCFSDDYKASFSKTFFTLPISDHKKVGSRYCTFLIALSVAFTFSSFLSILIGLMTHFKHFKTCIYIVTYVSCLFILYMSFVMLWGFIFGSSKVQTASLILGAILIISGIIIAELCLANNNTQKMLSIINKFKYKLINPLPLLLFIALTAILYYISFAISVKAVRRRRGTL